MKFYFSIIGIIFIINCFFNINSVSSQQIPPECGVFTSCSDTCDPAENGFITNDFGLIAPDDQNSLKAGLRGPVLMEDFNFREKMTHFDHERIPERVVHARGAAAHGFFELYTPQDNITTAHFLTGQAGKTTPVFVRFSTVAGSRGSADTPRDVRGFAVRFYTEEGNFDLVGNNIPIFFIQDAIKFPDLIHAVKPEPNNEIPQAQTAHDNFWDFASLSPETTAMIMWIMSDRTLPRYYSTMQGFGVHTFRLVNALNETKLVKFFWNPVVGVHSTLWDEAQKLAGKDPDFQRRNLFDSIEAGVYPEWEFGIQIVEESDMLAFGFDLLDATKLIPEELVPVHVVGRMVLNRNPDNYFAETEQVAYHLGHIVPGIQFTDDPLLQGRLFSYVDTQLNRFSSPNWDQLPINRPIVPVRNNQQDGFMRYENMKGRVNYEPNSFNPGGCPFSASISQGAYFTWPQRLDVNNVPIKIRGRSPTFNDFYSQASLFFNSLSYWEKAHLTQALQFELSKVVTQSIRQRMVDRLNLVNFDLAVAVANEIGVNPPTAPGSVYNQNVSEALSMQNTIYAPKGLKVGIIILDGFSYDQVTTLQNALANEGIMNDIIADRLGAIFAGFGGDQTIIANKTLMNSESVFYDAIFIPDLDMQSYNKSYRVGKIKYFVAESYKHCKPIGLIGMAEDLIAAAEITDVAISTNNETVVDLGVVTVAEANGNAESGDFLQAYIDAVIQQRFFERQNAPGYGAVPTS